MAEQITYEPYTPTEEERKQLGLSPATSDMGLPADEEESQDVSYEPYRPSAEERESLGLLPEETQELIGRTQETGIGEGFATGFKGGVQQMQGLLQAIPGLAASAIEKVPQLVDPRASEIDSALLNRIKKSSFAGFQRNMEEASAYEKPVSFDDMSRLHGLSLGEKIKATTLFAAGTLGELGPSMIEAGVSAVVGGAVGGAASGGNPAGVGAGAVGGFFGKRAVNHMTKELAERYMAKFAKQGITKEVAEGLATAQIERTAASAIMKTYGKSFGRKVGVVGGVGAIESSGNWGEAMEQGIDNPYTALATGMMAGYVEILGGNFALIDKWMGPRASRAFKDAVNKVRAAGDRNAMTKAVKAATGIFLAAAKNGGAEFAQEAGQEALSMANIALNDPTFEFATRENILRLVEAGTAGLVAGGAGGFVGGVLDAARTGKADEGQQGTPPADEQPSGTLPPDEGAASPAGPALDQPALSEEQMLKLQKFALARERELASVPQEERTEEQNAEIEFLRFADGNPEVLAQEYAPKAQKAGDQPINVTESTVGVEEAEAASSEALPADEATAATDLTAAPGAVDVPDPSAPDAAPVIPEAPPEPGPRAEPGPTLDDGAPIWIGYDSAGRELGGFGTEEEALTAGREADIMGNLDEDIRSVLLEEPPPTPQIALEMGTARRERPFREQIPGSQAPTSEDIINAGEFGQLAETAQVAQGPQALPAEEAAPGALPVDTGNVRRERGLRERIPGSQAAAVPTIEEIEAISQEREAAPTEGQKEAENYKVGKLKYRGMDLSIENAVGDERFPGVPMKHPYGRIKRTEGADGDHVDFFMGPNPESEQVVVVDQVSPETGRFDEHKVMLGFPTPEAAQEGYLANYEEGWQGLGGATVMSQEEFKAWLKEGDQTKPLTQLPERAVDVPEGQSIVERGIAPADYGNIPKGMKVKVKAVRQETGQVVEMEEDAAAALSEADATLDTYNTVLECLRT